jgi:hypothetical protein
MVINDLKLEMEQKELSKGEASSEVSSMQPIHSLCSQIRFSFLLHHPNKLRSGDRGIRFSQHYVYKLPYYMVGDRSQHACVTSNNRKR